MKYNLENIKVKNPCSMDWEDMTGNDEIRFCGRCQQNIYNISEMPKRRALKVLNQPNEKICISYFLDEKKQIITQTYPGIFKRNFAKIIPLFLALIFSFSSIQAMQIKNGKPRKKRVSKHYKNKKKVIPIKRIIGRQTIGLPHSNQ
ncbi:MAG: hypothetical protein K1X72_04775 [Pyrinomonadaceae bacterium]|nr:hypothetical protein [Pyrinomonadaceae bacterium]